MRPMSWESCVASWSCSSSRVRFTEDAIKSTASEIVGVDTEDSSAKRTIADLDLTSRRGSRQKSRWRTCGAPSPVSRS